MELTPQAVYEFAELNNIINRLLAKLQTGHDRRILSFIYCSLHNNCRDLGWRDETIAHAVDSLAQTIAEVRAGRADDNQLMTATQQFKAALESRKGRWSFSARLAG